MALPANVGYGTVTGVFLRAVIDGADDGNEPDGIPISGLKVVFTASISPALVRNTTAVPPVTFFVDPVSAVTDSSGVLVSPDGTPGIVLIASDDTDLDPHNWTWKVTISGPSVAPVSFYFALPTGTTVDLSTVVPVPASPGDAVAVWQQAVADTAANVTLAQAAATDAQNAADSLDVSSFVKTVNGTAPDGSGNVVVAGGGSGSGTVTSVNTVAPDGSGNITLDAAAVGARADDWLPTPADIGARPDTWTPTAADVGALPSTYEPAAADISDASEVGQSVITAVDGDVIRTVIGAGTSDVVIGTTAGTAADAAAAATATAAVASDLAAHAAETDNPHAVTAAQVGLGNANNTADTAKPVSTATQAALDAQIQIVVWTGTAWPASRSAAVARYFMSTNDAAATAPTGLAVGDLWFRSKDA